MAEVGPGRASGLRPRPGRARAQRRPPTWEISDSDAESTAAAEAGAGAREAARERRGAAEALRPERVLGRLAVGIDPAVLEDVGADVLMEALGALGCECRIEPQRLARSLRWSEVSPDPGPSGVLPEVWAADEQELLLLLLLEPQEFLQGTAQLTQCQVLAHKQARNKGAYSNASKTWGVPTALLVLGDTEPISPEPAMQDLKSILLHALDFSWESQSHPSCCHRTRCLPVPSARRMPQPKSPEVAQAGAAIGWPEVEEALVLLQLCADLDVLLVASWQELSQHVCAFTKALARRPSRKCQDVQALSFCTAGRWASGQQVTRDGMGLQGVWWRQIRQFNRVSPAVAKAVVAAFPSPRLLQQALMACSTEQERLGLLADLPVRAHKGRQPRRVGPDLARRICLFLTTTNPDLLLDVGP